MSVPAALCVKMELISVPVYIVLFMTDWVINIDISSLKHVFMINGWQIHVMCYLWGGVVFWPKRQ